MNLPFKPNAPSNNSAIKEAFGAHICIIPPNLLERGKGDSVKEIKNYWGDASIDDIYNRVESWKASKLIDDI